MFGRWTADSVTELKQRCDSVRLLFLNGTTTGAVRIIKKKLIMEKENWIKWLQERIPELKKSHNEFWIGLALDGYLQSKQNQALSRLCVVGQSEQLTCECVGLGSTECHKINDKWICSECNRPLAG